MHQLTLHGLAELPQVSVLRHAAQRLWHDPSVRAIWLGGSFASNSADAYSDIDLRVAVPRESLDRWRAPNWRDLLGQNAVGVSLTPFGDDAFLHHLVAEDGTIIDLFVQSTQRDNFEPTVHVIGCRDDTFADRLATFARPPRPESSAAAPESVRQLLVNTWVGSHKHRKVLARDLPMVATVGVHAERMSLVQLMYTLHTGREVAHRPTIHGLTPVAQALADVMGPRLLELIGMPMRSVPEIIAVIEAQQQELVSVGRALAERLAFDYPRRLEDTVRQAWRAFVASGDRSG